MMNESPTAVLMLCPFGQTMLDEFVMVNAPLAETSFISPTTADAPKLLIVVVPLMVMSVCGDAPMLTVDADTSVAIPPPSCGSQFELTTSSVPTRSQFTPSKNLNTGKLTLVVSNHAWNSSGALLGPLAGADAPELCVASAS